MDQDPPRELVALHYHLRPGGVRRVMELLLPALAPHFDRVTLLTGEAPGDSWTGALAASVPGLRVAVHPALNYFIPGEKNPLAVRREIRRALTREAGPQSLIWAHNLALGRNLLLADEVAAHSAATGARLLSHHHDFWCDQRWARWPEMRASGFRSLARVAQAVFASGARVVHAGINSADAGLLARHLPATAWLPNPIDLSPPPDAEAVAGARAWLTAQLGDSSPVWLSPTRLLRRKNLAEAILLTRWLNPSGWLVTTGGASSPAEIGYFRRLDAACRNGGWRVRLGLLESVPHPALPALMRAADALVMTSVQEGFGFPYLEGAGLGCRTLARRLPNVQPDLETFGLSLPGLYHEVMIPPGVFDAEREVARQKALLGRWLHHLPRSSRLLAGPPPLIASPKKPVAFSRLSLEAQLEVLALPPAESLRMCRRANAETLRASMAPPARRPPGTFLSPSECANRLLALRFDKPSPTPTEASATQFGFLRERTASLFLFPLLMEESRG